jgi:hypothetical protein
MCPNECVDERLLRKVQYVFGQSSTVNIPQSDHKEEAPDAGKAVRASQNQERII